MQPRYVDEYPVLRIGDIAPQGLFFPADQAHISTPSKHSIVEVKRLFPEFGCRATIIVRVYEHGATSILTLVRTQQGASYRYYFVCPITGEHVARLYLRDHQFGSRKAFNLQYRREPERTPEQERDRVCDLLQGTAIRGPARGANRIRLVQRLIGLDDVWTKRARRILAAEGERLEAKQIRLQRPPKLDLLGAAAGLSGGSQDDQPADAYRGRLSDAEESLRLDVGKPIWRLAPHAGPKAALEDHIRVDIRALASGGYLDGERGIARHRWRLPDTTHAGAHVMAELGAPEPYALILIEMDCEQQVQAVRLARATRGRTSRWTFLCPVTGKPADVLAFRDGRFASRQAQNLVNRSQRSFSYRRGAR